MEPTEKDLKDPVFDAIWQAIKNWDIGIMDMKKETVRGYHEATGTDVMAIISNVRKAIPQPAIKKGVNQHPALKCFLEDYESGKKVAAIRELEAACHNDDALVNILASALMNYNNNK